MDKRAECAARLSLSFLWLITGITSMFFAKDIGYEVLAKAGITGSLANAAIISGSVLDIAIGLWLLVKRHLRVCYLLQLAVIVVYTVLLSLIAPSFWLHPFGPLTKNIPIVVMIYYLYRQSDDRPFR
ncbi:MAG: DoxX-like family protein [Candidatus Oceanisphaera merdipullorum]|nr:DoxX-like family protein [Candidatus Oceanisphaera merdipullorum]